MFEDLEAFLLTWKAKDNFTARQGRSQCQVRNRRRHAKNFRYRRAGFAVLNIKGYAGWRVLGGLFKRENWSHSALACRGSKYSSALTLEDKRIPPEIVSSAP